MACFLGLFGLELTKWNTQVKFILDCAVAQGINVDQTDQLFSSLSEITGSKIGTWHFPKTEAADRAIIREFTLTKKMLSAMVTPGRLEHMACTGLFRPLDPNVLVEIKGGDADSRWRSPVTRRHRSCDASEPDLRSWRSTSPTERLGNG